MITLRSLALFSLVFMSLLISQTAAAETVCRVELRADSLVTVCYSEAEWAQIEEARRQEIREQQEAARQRDPAVRAAAARERAWQRALDGELPASYR
jgi:hypothetical protein